MIQFSIDMQKLKVNFELNSFSSICLHDINIMEFIFKFETHEAETGRLRVVV